MNDLPNIEQLSARLYQGAGAMRPRPVIRKSLQYVDLSSARITTPEGKRMQRARSTPDLLRHHLTVIQSPGTSSPSQYRQMQLVPAPAHVPMRETPGE
jgi:hypothetical protein